MEGCCYIVGAGAFTARDFAPRNGDLVIAADGGYLALERMGVTPHLLLGDFDSLGGLPKELPPSVEVRRYPERKDDTDMGIALHAGFSRGCRRFLIYGGGGGRLDHLLANLQCMCRYQKQGASMRLVDLDYDVFTLHNESLTLPKRPEGTLVSVFCSGDAARGVTLCGLSYPLTNATLTCDFPLGVSNRYAGGEAKVSVVDGTLLVMVYCSASGSIISTSTPGISSLSV